MVDISYFLISFVFYTFLDIAWCKFIKGIEKDEPMLAGLSSVAISFIVFSVSYIVYVEKNWWGFLGALLGSFFGGFVGCKMVNK